MNINQKGCFAEYKFATMAIEYGFNVSMPLLDASTYDCLIERHGKVFKIQVKYVSANRQKDPEHNNTRVTLHREGGVYPKHLCDFFAVWFDEYNGFFIIPNVEQKAMRLSLTNKYKDNFNNFDIIL
jgi:hypothetical protein